MTWRCGVGYFISLGIAAGSPNTFFMYGWFSCWAYYYLRGAITVGLQTVKNFEGVQCQRIDIIWSVVDCIFNTCPTEPSLHQI